MYKNRVKNNRNFFEIPALLTCEQGNQEGKIQNNIYILNFPILFSAGFPRSQDKRTGISNFFYTYPVS